MILHAVVCSALNRQWCIDSYPARWNACTLTSVGCSTIFFPMMPHCAINRTADTWHLMFLQSACVRAITVSISSVALFSFQCFASYAAPTLAIQQQLRAARQFMQMRHNLKAASRMSSCCFKVREHRDLIYTAIENPISFKRAQAAVGVGRPLLTWCNDLL